MMRSHCPLHMMRMCEIMCVRDSPHRRKAHIMNADITPTELAKLCDTDPKTMRRFMRSHTDVRVGRGGRWEISADDAARLVASFKSRSTSRVARFDASPFAGVAVDDETQQRIDAMVASLIAKRN